MEITYSEFEKDRNDIGDLDNIRTVVINEIDKTAGVIRLKYITAVPGQPETYIMKAADARDILALPSIVGIDMTKYPMMAAEIAATQSNDIIASCNAVIATETMWRNIAALIEKERRIGKISVDSATEITQIIAARNSAIMALESL